MRGRRCGAVSLRNGRPVNMDCLLAKPLPSAGRGVWLAVVCDEVGSLREGGLSAGMAVDQLERWADGLAVLERAGLRLRDEVIRINRRIWAQTSQAGVETATTLSALLLTPERYYLAHVGDSRIYRWDGDRLTQLTRDDTAADGRLAASVGHRAQIMPQYGEGPAAGAGFLLCTDGLYKRMDPDRLREGLRRGGDPERCLRALAECAAGRGETDNISAILIWDGGGTAS